MVYPHKWSPISYTGRAHDSESTPAKDRCSTAGPCNQRTVLFCRIRQVPPLCTVSNAWFVGPIRVHIPQRKRHLDRFSRFCTADGRESLYFAMGRPIFPSKLPLPTGRSGPPSNDLIHGCLGLYRSPQAKRHPHLRRCRRLMAFASISLTAVSMHVICRR